MKTAIPQYLIKQPIREYVLTKVVDWALQFHEVLKKKRIPWNLSRSDLLNYEQGTLGNMIGKFLIKKDLHPLPRLESHDAYHLLLDYDTVFKDETALFYFSLGNGYNSIFLKMSSFAAFIFFPEDWLIFWEHFKRGKNTRPIHKWDFKELLSENYQDLKKLIKNESLNNSALIEKIKRMEL